ncbi:AGE family epimerase/isomerase [Branchiibius sp. NY16-3462-2]|uniref:AGE family epimerase/isomerase n=1 Tax=Branchiibius sp. NY16-3462-2 TaxID=1807500 RepID=UPI00079A04E9|nr:AGE family epimerase/isomerase [Branchiibius sp. NY16-3462-2]KYH45252.1 N-acyl-D-glucosamine 2-epimerase [Branchiibius sp. NY16-3462-2]
MTTPWPDLPTHREWLHEQARSLLTFGRRTPSADGGAYWLDDHGNPLPQNGIHTWITARTVHVYSLGHLMGLPGCTPIAQAALDGLTGRLHDSEYGGWLASVGQHDADGTKAAYAHAFVLLAASSGVTAGLSGAEALLADAQDVLLERFWDEEAGLAVDEWDRTFSTLDPYRGINANMHLVEACLAAADVTGDRSWLERASRISQFVVTQAEGNGWRIPEHFDADWQPQLELNRDKPGDQFKPYGATVGHGLEWSRLLIHLDAALGIDRDTDWVTPAKALFDRAVTDGWAADGADGFVYTTDWSGRPVVRERMHWVVAEALGAAVTLWHRTGDPAYADRYAQWWDYTQRYVIDHENGSWHHELDAANQPAATVWAGKPDLYHAFQATLLPLLPLTPSFATAIAQGHLA